MSAKTDFLIDRAHDCDPSLISKERQEYARERCAKLLSVVKSRNGAVVPVSECAKILSVDKGRITRLVMRNDIWHAKQRMWFESLHQWRPARVVQVDEVRAALAKIDTDLAEKIKKPQKQKNEQLPDGWISITDFAALTAIRRTTLNEWCKRDKVCALKFVVAHYVGHASLEWCIPRDESIERLREIIAASRNGAHGGNVIQPNPRVSKTALIESIWRKPETAPEVSEFWEQGNG